MTSNLSWGVCNQLELGWSDRFWRELQSDLAHVHIFRLSSSLQEGQKERRDKLTLIIVFEKQRPLRRRDVRSDRLRLDAEISNVLGCNCHFSELTKNWRYMLRCWSLLRWTGNLQARGWKIEGRRKKVRPELEGLIGFSAYAKTEPANGVSEFWLTTEKALWFIFLHFIWFIHA